MADFMRLTYENLRLKQFQIANQIGFSTSTLQRYRNEMNEINMLSPYKINPNNTNKRTKKVSNGNFDNNSHHESNVKDLKWPQSISESHHEVKPVESKKTGGANIEINEHYLDEILHNNNS